MALALAERMAEARVILSRALELERSFCIHAMCELGYAPEIEALWVRGARLLGVPD
jgi:hypothetical protein